MVIHEKKKRQILYVSRIRNKDDFFSSKTNTNIVKLQPLLLLLINRVKGKQEK